MTRAYKQNPLENLHHMQKGTPKGRRQRKGERSKEEREARELRSIAGRHAAEIRRQQRAEFTMAIDWIDPSALRAAMLGVSSSVAQASQPLREAAEGMRDAAERLSRVTALSTADALSSLQAEESRIRRLQSIAAYAGMRPTRPAEELLGASFPDLEARVLAEMMRAQASAIAAATPALLADLPTSGIASPFRYAGRLRHLEDAGAGVTIPLAPNFEREFVVPPRDALVSHRLGVDTSDMADSMAYALHLMQRMDAEKKGPEHPDAGKPVASTRRFKRTVGGEAAQLIRQEDGTVRRVLRITDDNSPQGEQGT